MAKDEEREERAAAEPTLVDVEVEEDDDDDAGSPFDHPAFLPVLLWALALWFGYDGFINQDPEIIMSGISGLTPEIVEEIFNPSSKVDVPVAFSLTNGEDMEITLDFDAALSVQVNETGGQHPYILRPVINVAGVN